MAALYHEQGRYQEAEPLYQPTLAIYEQALGEEHSLTQTIRDDWQRLLREKKSHS